MRFFIIKFELILIFFCTWMIDLWFDCMWGLIIYLYIQVIIKVNIYIYCDNCYTWCINEDLICVEVECTYHLFFCHEAYDFKPLRLIFNM